MVLFTVEKLAAIEAIEKRIRAGEKPAKSGTAPEGVRLDIQPQDIFGGGHWFVVGTDWIWHVSNNGDDGDDWSYNNVATGGAGAIGFRVPYNKTLAAEIEAVFTPATEEEIKAHEQRREVARVQEEERERKHREFLRTMCS